MISTPFYAGRRVELEFRCMSNLLPKGYIANSNQNEKEVAGFLFDALGIVWSTRSIWRSVDR